MCLGVLGRIVEIWDEPSGARMAHVEFPGEVRRLCPAYLGFALTGIDEAAEQVTVATMAGYGVFGDRRPLRQAPFGAEAVPA